MDDVTESWHTFTEAEGVEYLAAYVTIWHCPACGTVAGAQDSGIEWTMRPEEALQEE
ncbi:MAG TPA: hypothetical protein VKX16_08055 [Chloroflexota bacterium]|nr:hypothetical protein [Chloroflexota bacterium]